MEQMDIFDMFSGNEKPEYNIDRKVQNIKIISLFSGIGAFEKAFDNLGIPYELVAYCEIDKYASASYSAIHNVPESMNLGDITKVDEKALPKDIDLCTYGFPCQDISLSGKMKGLLQCEECQTSNEIPENYVQRLKDGEKFFCEKCGAELKQTRSGLFFEALRIIEATQPRIAIAENVKNLTSKKFKEQFEIVLDSLETAGYNNYWAVLNSKDFGVPQNRERVFIVSIRKDIDTGTFKFPDGFPLEIRLKDILEDEVDEKYYLSDKMIDYLFTITEKNKARGNGNVYVPTDPDGIAKTITTKEGSRVKDNFIEESAVKKIGNIYPSGGQNGNIYDENGISPTLLSGETNTKGNGGIGSSNAPKVLVREATKQGYAEAFEGDSINLEQPNSKTRRGRVGKQIAQTLTTSPQQAVVESDRKFSKNKNICLEVYREMAIASECELPVAIDEQNVTIRKDGTVGTITTDGSSPKHNNRVLEPSLRIRKLTPKECFRLMGFDDADFEKAEAANSNTQLYKQAGNSIVVPVVEYIIKALLDCGVLNKEKEKEYQKEMELKIEPYKAPDQISFNYEELKNILIEKASHYETIVYTEDQIQDAKADRANLNRLKKALNDERIKREKEYMTSFNVFKAQVNEIIGIIDKPVSVIDRQIKAAEERAKEEKMAQIQDIWIEACEAGAVPAGIIFDRLFNEKWLNVSVKLPAIAKEIKERLEQIEKDLAVIENLPAYAFEAKEVYTNTLDLAKAISEANRLRELAEKKAAWEAEQEMRKAEAEAEAAAFVESLPSTPINVPEEPVREWVKFQAFMSVSEAKALGQYMREHGIKYKSV